MNIRDLIIDDKYFCHKCESIIPENLNPDRALCFTITGGYGMFVDLEKIELIFCHDCSVEFFRSIPSLSSDKINGQHTISSKGQCCEYSWNIDDDLNTVFGKKEDFQKGENNES
jgi:hypothetical protein